MTKVTPFLMFRDQLEDAVAFYTTTFPDSKVLQMARDGHDGPMQSAEFIVGGQRLMGFNGGDHFSFNDGVSLFVDCVDQDEVDRYWKAILDAGGQEQQCGWIIDPFGLRWQIVPRRLMELIGHKDPKKAKAAADAMFQMVKIDVATLEKAVQAVR